MPSPKNSKKVLSSVLYCYVEPANGEHAKEFGAKVFGSFSAYVNALISKDRGVTPHLGSWKVKEDEARIKRAKKAKKKSFKRKQAAFLRKMTKNKIHSAVRKMRKKSGIFDMPRIDDVAEITPPEVYHEEVFE